MPVHALASATAESTMSTNGPTEDADRLGTILAYTVSGGGSMRHQGSQAHSQLPFQQTRDAHAPSVHILQTPVPGHSSVVVHCGCGFDGHENTHAPSTQSKPAQVVALHATQLGGPSPQSVGVRHFRSEPHCGMPGSHLRSAPQYKGTLGSHLPSAHCLHSVPHTKPLHGSRL